MHHVCLSGVDEDTLLAYLDALKGQYKSIEEMYYKAHIGFSSEIFTMPLQNGFVTIYLQTKAPEKRDWAPWILFAAGLMFLAATIIPLL